MLRLCRNVTERLGNEPEVGQQRGQCGIGEDGGNDAIRIWP